MKKIEKTDWFTSGLAILETEGFLKITIENLCTMLNVTKGSFYHHFGNIDGYTESLMKYWADKNTKSLIEKSSKFESAEEKVDALNRMVLLRSHKSEQIIRGWSFSNPIVRKQVEEVDRIRISYTASLMEQCGQSGEAAKQTALLEYACLVGIQQLAPDMPHEKLEELHELFSSKIHSS